MRTRRGMTLGIVALVALVAGLAGCDTGTPSALKPDDPVNVHGRLVGPDGKPVPRTRVVLYRQPGLGEALGDTFVIFASAGTACLADSPPTLCRDARRVVSADDGSFSFTMKGSDTYEGRGSLAATFTLSAALPAHGDQLTGPDTTQSFKIQVQDLKVPDVAFWQPQVDYSGSGNSAKLTWSAIPAGLGEGPTFEAEFEDPNGNLAWAYPNLHSPATVDARMLEDHEGGVAVHARPHQAGTGTVFNIDYRSPSVAFRGSAGPPLSRRRACYVASAQGAPVRQRPCRLTDGDIDVVYRPTDPCPASQASPCPRGAINAPYIDLGAPANIDLAVVHGCVSSCVIDGSLDLQTWTPLGGRHLTDPGQTPNGLSAFPLPARSRARYIRTTFEAHDYSRLTEISVWGPAGQPLPPSTEPLPPPPRSLATGGHPAQAGGGLSSGQLGVLVLLNILGLALIGIAVLALVRRRTRPAGTP